MASGWLDNDGISLNEERNLLTFYTATPENGYLYSFYVNGAKVPLTIDFSNAGLQEYSVDRNYFLRFHGTYEDLCTVDAWGVE